MSGFVNYKKRSITLPAGCKDLVDVLARPLRRRKHPSPLADPPGSKLEETHLEYLECLPVPQFQEAHFATKGLAEVGRFVAMLLQSRTPIFTVQLTAQQLPFDIVLYRNDLEQTPCICLITNEQHWELAVRAFFRRLAFEPIFDPMSEPKPLAFAGGTLGGWRIPVYPLPTDVSRATRLMMELLVSVCGLGREAGLDFRYFSWPLGSKQEEIP